MYFEKAGKGNTKETLEAAYARSRELGIAEIVVASTTGNTAYLALEICKGCRITAVTYHAGFKEPFKSVMDDDAKRDLEAKGVTVVKATHALSGLERCPGTLHRRPGSPPGRSGSTRSNRIYARTSTPCRVRALHSPWREPSPSV